MDTLTEIPAVIANGAGVVSLLSILFWMLATDRLITGPAHRRELDSKDDTIAKQDKTIEVQDKQLEDLAVIGETNLRILKTVEDLAKDRK
jgi:hypothetical protein